MARFIGIGTPYLCIDKYLCPTRLRLVQISVFPIFLFFRFCGETIWACPIFLFFRFLGETIEAWNSIFPLESFHVSIAYRLFAPIEKSRCFLKLSHATETLLSNTKYSTSHRLCASGTSSRYLNIPPFICETSSMPLLMRKLEAYSQRLPPVQYITTVVELRKPVIHGSTAPIKLPNPRNSDINTISGSTCFPTLSMGDTDGVPGDIILTRTRSHRKGASSPAPRRGNC